MTCAELFLQELATKRRRSNPACFVCGAINPSGLHLSFEAGLSEVQAEWVPGPTLESFEGTIHGGIIGTVMDEAMSKAIIASNWDAVTAELRVRYLRQVVPGESLQVCGWIVSRRKKLIKAEARLQTIKGDVRAHAWGTFLIVQNRTSDTARLVSDG